MSTAEQLPVTLDDLLRVFFAAEHNSAWPDMSDDPQWAKWKDRVDPFVKMARRGDDMPIVLPRLRPGTGEYSLYVTVTDRAEIADIICSKLARIRSCDPIVDYRCRILAAVK